MLKKSDDLDAGLLNYRNTPPRGHSYSPAQPLFNRRTRTTIPTSDAPLVPEVVSRDTVHQEILNKRASANVQYDKDCKGQHMPLTAGDYVYVKPPPAKRGQPWTYGRVSGSPAPRSYVIETPTGYMHRNRTQIQSAQPPTFYHASPPKTHTTPPLTPKPLMFVCLFMYTASVIFDYYCRDSELSYTGGLGSSLHLLWRELGSLTCLRVTLPRTRNLHL